MNAGFPLNKTDAGLWFAAKMRFAVLIENTGRAEYEDRVYIFQYSDLDNVLEQAVRVGKNHEHQYANMDGNQVRWKLVRILKVMIIPADTGSLDEIEVYSERVAATDDSQSFDWEPSDDSIRDGAVTP
jgi:hypothetical protein